VAFTLPPPRAGWAADRHRSTVRRHAKRRPTNRFFANLRGSPEGQAGSQAGACVGVMAKAVQRKGAKHAKHAKHAKTFSQLSFAFFAPLRSKIFGGDSTKPQPSLVRELTSACNGRPSPEVRREPIKNPAVRGSFFWCDGGRRIAWVTRCYYGSLGKNISSNTPSNTPNRRGARRHSESTGL